MQILRPVLAVRSFPPGFTHLKRGNIRRSHDSFNLAHEANDLVSHGCVVDSSTTNRVELKLTRDALIPLPCQRQYVLIRPMGEAPAS